MGKISLRFNGKKYDITLEEKYHKLESEYIRDVFSMDGENDLKDLLQAYLKVCNEKIELQDEMIHLLKKLESNLTPKSE